MRKARATLLWFACAPGLLKAGRQQSEWSALGRSVPWRAAFESARDGGTVAFAPPWPARGTATHAADHRFWATYVSGGDDSTPSRSAAWRSFVPLVPEVPLAFPAEPRGSRWMTAQGRVYPHGVALVVDVRTPARRRQPTQLEDYVDHLARIRQRPVTALWMNTVVEEPLHHLARRALRWMGDQLVGAKGYLAHVDRPFAVVTVLEVPRSQTEVTDEVRSALWGLASGSPVGSPPAHFEERRLAFPDRPDDVLLAVPGGRAVWFPALLPPSYQRRFATDELGTHHRELAAVSLQTMSAARLVQHLHGRLDDDDEPSAVERSCLRNAALLLRSLHGQHVSTYRSLSPARQLVDDGCIPVLNAALARFGFPPVAAPATPAVNAGG